MTLEETKLQSISADKVEQYLCTYYSLMRSNSDVHIRTLEKTHGEMESLLHTNANDSAPDMSAFIYSLLRLPECISKLKNIYLGQSAEVFLRAGIGDVNKWQSTSGKARRRRCFYDGKQSLACTITSQSDVDDMIPMLTAYQIEINKLHKLMLNSKAQNALEIFLDNPEDISGLADALQISVEDFERLQQIWGAKFIQKLEELAKAPVRIKIRLLNGSISEYRHSTQIWWKQIEDIMPDLMERPVYFVSSNMHSMSNIISGYALENRDLLIRFLEEFDNGILLREWIEIQAEMISSNTENFFYYVLKKFLQSSEGRAYKSAHLEYENRRGIAQIRSSQNFDVDAQVIALSKICPEKIDPRVHGSDLSFLKESNAYILNIDYPLGMAAYNILTKVSEHLRNIRGIYIIGKAATLNGAIGDVMIPNIVHDTHTQNQYIFSNAFKATDVDPYFVYGTAIDNQKAVTVRGTFLQNADYMYRFYKEGFTDIEMEAGPYLSAVYEMCNPSRHPTNELVDLYGLPFDLGILHYASDTPLSKGKNLGAGTLSYYGMDPTYAASIACLRRIIDVEKHHMGRTGFPVMMAGEAQKKVISTSAAINQIRV